MYMLRPNLPPHKPNLRSAANPSEEISLEQFMSADFKKVTIDEPYVIFNDQILNENAVEVNYGILKFLEGDWFSYIEEDSKRVSNTNKDEFNPNVGSGVHTTIMPSPGTTQNNIPGKFSFECDEYIEKLSFSLVPGGVRNRGGANEQFCGAIKYDQTIKSISPDKIQFIEQIYDFIHNPENTPILSDKWGQVSASNSIYPQKLIDFKTAQVDKFNELNKDVKILEVLHKLTQLPGIHEENGMYLWLSNLYKNPATQKSIKHDRGAHNWNNELAIKQLVENLYPTPPDTDELNNFKSLVAKHPFLDTPFYNIGSLSNPHYVTKLPQDLSTIVSVVPAKELQPAEGIDRPTFVPDYSISRSGVIPHGSTITLLGDLKSEAGSFLIPNKPSFVNPLKGTWDMDHMAFSPTMGGGISPTNDERPFDLYNPPLPFIPTEEFNEENDPGEEEVYTQQLFLHPLYPYSVRPDLRLRDATLNQVIKNHIKIELFSQKDTGAQGGILNIPFVNRFVPAISMKMNMWLETVIEDDREFLQLQYEQIINFQFGFGDGGGTTSWPHIQINTLRKFKDLNEYSKTLAITQFKSNDIIWKDSSPKCPFPTTELENSKTDSNAQSPKCPFSNPNK